MGSVQLERRLPPRAASAAAARRLVAEALEDTPYAGAADDALLAVSELVTNALVHAGTEIGVQVSVGERGVLVEVHDGSPQAPAFRSHARESGTGRGLRMVESLADDWGVSLRGEGKVVWFRIGDLLAGADQSPDVAGTTDDETVQVELWDFPLLMFAAWQEHSATLLREYLLMSLSEGDEGAAFERHAEASEALSLLADQLPPLDVGTEPDEVMSHAVEPLVTARRFVMTVRRSMLGRFDVLDQMMSDAVSASDDGGMLVPGTQPEMREMRRWLCDQILSQALTGAAPEPFAADLHHGVVSDPVVPEGWDPGGVATSERALVAANVGGDIVAVSASAAAMLGYEAAALVGRRVLTVIPPRFRQAHVAGVTLHAVNGRDALLGHEVTVPVLCADGTERQAVLTVNPVAAGGERIFVAELAEP